MNDFYKSSLSDKEFNKLSACIYREAGIKMPLTKKVMLEARLRKRLRELRLNSFTDYCDFLFTNEGMNSELVHMIDVVTTNKTDFFRESKQFGFLFEQVLPVLNEFNGAGVKRNLKIWSAGCSTGEEPYTIAMVVNEYSEAFTQYDYSVLATDISTQVLQKAFAGIYETEKVEPVPHNLLTKYFLKSKDKQKLFVRIIPEIRKKIIFQRLNFMDDDYGIKERFDIIFCRNVIIYFDKETQEKILAKLLKYLIPGGYLFLGHSETIFNPNLHVNQVMASTYRKEN